MSVHLYIDQSGVVGVCLNRIPERHCWSCTYRKLNVFIKVLMQCTCGPVGVLNVVGIHKPLHE